MAGIYAKAITVALTAGGSADGFITVADNTGVYVGTNGYIAHAGVAVAVTVTELVGTTKIGLRLTPGSIQDATTQVPGPDYGRTNLTTFLTGDVLTIPAQFAATTT